MASLPSPIEPGGLLTKALAGAAVLVVTQSVLAVVFAHEDFWKTSWVISSVFMGPGVLSWPPAFDLAGISAALAALYPVSLFVVLILFAFVSRLAFKWAILAGALLGLAIYFFDLYGIVSWFPWLVRERTWMMALSHIALGGAAAGLVNADRRGTFQVVH